MKLTAYSVNPATPRFLEGYTVRSVREAERILSSISTNMQSADVFVAALCLNDDEETCHYYGVTSNNVNREMTTYNRAQNLELYAATGFLSGESELDYSDATLEGGN